MFGVYFKYFNFHFKTIFGCVRQFSFTIKITAQPKIVYTIYILYINLKKLSKKDIIVKQYLFLATYLKYELDIFKF